MSTVIKLSSESKIATSVREGTFRIAQALTAVVVVLAAVAAAGGLFIPGLYRDSAWVIGANRGMDLFTLVGAVPTAVVALLASKSGSVRAKLVLVGVLGYVLYTYIGGAFAFAFNDFFLIYIALFSLSLFSLAATVSSIDISGLQASFDEKTPRKPVAIFLVVIALMLAAGELSQIIPALAHDTLPEVMKLAEGMTFFPYAMDLGVIMPLSLFTAVSLWRKSPWGYLLTGCMLIKCATMGLALLVTTWYIWFTGGTPDDASLITGYAIIAGGGLGMSVWFFGHCRG